ncbi:MAG: ABC transporter permease [Actinomycetota bacterium]|nr:ABC transporter permease [Actinomycetota bacterium]
MWLLTLRDLQWRRRRFAIAVVATATAFAMSLLMSWVNARLHNEPGKILEVLGADAWVVDEGTSGPFTASKVVSADLAEAVARIPGVAGAHPVVLLHSTMQSQSTRDVNVIGLPTDAPRWPPVTQGRLPDGPGETVADTAAALDVGDEVSLAGRRLHVVGLAEGVSYYFGAPTFFVPLADAQAVAFAGQPLAMAIATHGVPRSAPAGLEVLSPEQVEADLARILAGSTQTIGVLNALLVVMAAGIIGSIVYLSALERTRDFAVLKATGASSRALFAGLAAQAIALSLVAAVAGAVLAKFALTPLIPFGADITASSFVTLAVVAVAVGLCASLVGLQRAIRVDPALAFRGA